jgi:predicted NUDIX family phosphoesterase
VTPGRSEELVYVVPRRALFDGPAWRGVEPGEGPAAVARIERQGTYVPRSKAELDPSLKQIIPYLVLRDGERLFLMRRTRAGGDARLHDLYSIGVGGHLNPGDGSVLAGLRREWQEEIEAEFVPAFAYLGLLNDDTVEVGSVHLGVVYVADAAGRAVAIRETDKLRGSFETVAAVRAAYRQMETWSQLVFDALVPDAGPGSSRPVRRPRDSRTCGRRGESHP